MTFGLIVFMLLMAANQMITARATRLLTVEQKALVTDASSGGGIVWMLVFIAALYGLESLVSDIYGHSRWLLLVFVIVVFVAALGFGMLHLRRLSRLGLPAHYLRSARWGMILVDAGLFLQLGIITYESFTFFPT